MSRPDDRYRALSLWLDRLPEELRPRPALPGDRSYDIAVVGGGLTGLWTAHHLIRADPGLRVAVLEREIAGFGASGRNGGWCSDLFPVAAATLAAEHGRPAALAMRAAMRDTLDRIEETVRAEGLDCGWARGGTVTLARSAMQLRRLDEDLARAREWGDTEDDLRRLEPGETAELIGAVGVRSATFTPHCAALDPGALVRGLARLVEAAGVHLYEGTTVRRWDGRRLVTDTGTVTAEVVVRATEAWTVQRPELHREIAPVYSLVIATEPLDADRLAAVRLDSRPTFADHRRIITYGQRTADGRLVFGGRGAPYHLGSRIRPRFDRDPAVFSALERRLVELFPALAGVRFTHRWGGPIAVPRDWHPSVGYDRATGQAWAGGYVGDGVSTSHLAGRTVTELITGGEPDLARLPWVDHRSPRWEPEPARWLGIHAVEALTDRADRREERTGRPSRLAALAERLMG